MSDTNELHWLVRSHLTPTNNTSISKIVVVIIIALSIFTLPISASDEQYSFNSSILSASIKIVREIRLHHHHERNFSKTSLTSSEMNAVKLVYEGHIYSCLAKITTHLEHCVQQFNESVDEHFRGNTEEQQHQPTEEKVRRYCCMQNDFKDCWTRSIRKKCSPEEARPSKWLPLEMLSDLRTDDRCKNYVLYPHKCRENIFSLWQILAFLLLMPFLAFTIILFTIISCNPAITYSSLSPFTVIHQEFNA